MTSPRAGDGDHERVPSGAELEELLRSYPIGDEWNQDREPRPTQAPQPRRPIAPPYTPPSRGDGSPGAPTTGASQPSTSGGAPEAPGTRNGEPRPRTEPAPERPGVDGQQAAADDNAVRLGIWGGVGTGKTTFLYTLPSAANQASRAGQLGDWTVVPLDDQSERYYELAARALEGDLELPQGTEQGAAFRLAWRLQERPRRDPWLPWRRRPGRRIELRMTDRSGRDFEDPQPELIDELVQAQGIVYLFDPAPEPRREALSFFGVTMSRLRARLARVDGLIDGLLPHHLAVCVSKFDETEIFSLARGGHWVTQEPRAPFRPRIDDPQGFFNWLCDDPGAGGAVTVKEQIRAYFDPQRVSYHVTSAVGFHIAPGDEFSLDDFDNLDVRGRKVRLRGRPRPMNVVEPLVALDDAIRRRR